MSRQSDYEKSKKYNVKEKTKSQIVLKVLLIILLLSLIFAIAAGGFLFFSWKKGKEAIANQPVQVNIKVDENKLEDFEEKPVIHNSGTMIEYKDKTYDINTDITTVLLAGIDKENLGDNSSYSAGQADVIILTAYDMLSGKVRFIVIPRDTMVDMDIYSTKEDKNKAKTDFEGINNQQICLAYAYGDGKELSCEYLKTCVSRALMGMPVNNYAVLDLNGVGAIAQAVGGVKVKSLETFENFEKDKEVLLINENALRYVQSRRHDIVNADSLRRARQKQFMLAFTDVCKSKIKNDLSIVTKLYKVATTYGFTSYDLSEVTYLASTAVTNDINLTDFTTIPGEYKQNGNYAEYYSDTQGLFELILDVFYKEV